VCDKSEVNFLLMRKQLTRTWETLVDCLADGKAPSKFNFYTYGDEGFGGEMDAPGQIAQCAANVLFRKTINRDEWVGNGSFRKSHGEAIEMLPCCRNDHEFLYVWNMCMYEGMVPSF